MIKNFLITGKPGCGKTTLIKEILNELKISRRGFFTDEIRIEGKRIGFEIITLSGKKGILAKIDFESPYRVSKYGVNLKEFEEIGVKEIEEGLKENCLIVIDEIGKMELFSEKFKQVVLEALNSENKVLGTIMLSKHPFSDGIKRRKDTVVFYLDQNNRNEVREKLLKALSEST